MSGYRSIFISDLHLGTRGCQAELLLEFLEATPADKIYLVGDIIDFWRIRKGVYWPKAHQDIIHHLLKRGREETEAIFIPGNHDEALRDFVGLHADGVSVMRQATHTAADGRRFLVLHGDEFDMVVKNHRWLSILGDSAYTVLLAINLWFNRTRRAFGFPYWSLSAYIKLRVKNAVNYISRFEDLVAAAAHKKGLDGVICGHIHHAEIRETQGVTYMNDGDWVESCTALAEDANGEFRIIRWNEEREHAHSDRVRRVASTDQRSHPVVEPDRRRVARARAPRVGAGA